jgi:putative acetyltransferase
MPEGIDILPMGLADFHQVVDLWQNTEGVGLNESDSRSNIESYLNRNPGMSFVARNGEQLVGAVLCGHDGRRGYLHHLAVARSHRGQKIGKQLVEACLRRLAADGILKCNIFLYSNNTSGELFWSSNGWNKRDDLRVMQKPINGL